MSQCEFTKIFVIQTKHADVGSILGRKKTRRTLKLGKRKLAKSLVFNPKLKMDESSITSEVSVRKIKKDIMEEII